MFLFSFWQIYRVKSDAKIKMTTTILNSFFKCFNLIVGYVMDRQIQHTLYFFIYIASDWFKKLLFFNQNKQQNLESIHFQIYKKLQKFCSNGRTAKKTSLITNLKSQSNLKNFHMRFFQDAENLSADSVEFLAIQGNRQYQWL